MTARPIRATELIDLAQALAPATTGPGRPRTARLRRAVSTAYYALFHELVDHATIELCGPDPQMRPQRSRLARWFAHGDVKVLAEVAAGKVSGKHGELAAVLGVPHDDLARVADAFLAMQEARHQADYDHEYDIKRPDALALVGGSADAIGRARSLQKIGDPSYQRFMRLMVGAVKIAQNRRG